MPRYSYQCKKCGYELETTHSYKERLKKCPDCKAEELVKLLNSPINLPHKKNLRRTSKSLDWWYRKIQTFTEEMFLYYPQSDKYKWGRVDKDPNIGYSRLICTAKK